MEEKPEQKRPEKEEAKALSGQEESGQKEGTGLKKLQKKLGAKVLGVFGRSAEKEKSEEIPGNETGKVEDKAGPPKEEAGVEKAKGGEAAGKEDIVEEKTTPEEGKTDTSDSEKTEEKAKEDKIEEKSPATAPEDTSAHAKSEEEEKKPADVQDKGETEKPAEKPAPKEKGEEEASRKKKVAKKEGEKKKEPAKPEKPPESLPDLLVQKEEVEALLSSIEDAYREATLPDKTYHEVKVKNEKRLEEINKKIEILQAQKPAEKEEPEEVKPELAGEERPEPAQPVPAGKPVIEEPARLKPVVRPAPRKPEMVPGKAEDLIKLLEEKIESKLKDVIGAASIEMTDKRITKLGERTDALESAIKDFKKTAETVSGYDKQFSLMNAEVEKTKALVESAKEAKNIMDEKVQHITESFAELRSIIYQREAAAKEQEVLIDKMKDTVSQMDTARILHEFTTRDEQLRDVNTRIEKLERSGKMLTESMNKIKGLMTDVGSLENIMRSSKHVGEKLERIQEIEEKIKAVASRLDSVYVDMKKKIDEFNTYKVKQDRLDGMANDLLKNVEDVTRRLSDYATKDDVEGAKRLIAKVKEESKAAAAEAHLPPEVRELQEEKEEIETLLATLEENLRNKEISEQEYNSAREGNIQRLNGIEKKIQSYSAPPKGGKPGPEKETEVGEGKHTKVMMLAKLRESYEKGEISKRAYDKSKKLLLKK